MGERERVHGPDIVKRFSLAQARWFTLLCALGVEALFGAGARNDSTEERRCLCHGVHKQPVSDARSPLQLDDLSVNVYAAGRATGVSLRADRTRSG